MFQMGGIRVFSTTLRGRCMGVSNGRHSCVFSTTEGEVYVC